MKAITSFLITVLLSAVTFQSNAQTAFTKAQSLKNIEETEKYKSVVRSINRGKKVPKWLNTLGKEDRNTIIQTSLFFDLPLSPSLKINQVRPQRFIEIVDVQTPRDTIGEDLETYSPYEEPANYSINSVAEYVPALQTTSGLASPSAIIDGTARFLVNRTKKELEIAFFDEFRHKIEKDTILPFLLPETHRLLRYQDYFQAPSLGKVWTTAFENDLRNTPLNLEKYIRTQKTNLLDTTELFIFSMAINCLNQVNEGAKIPILLDNLMQDYAFMDNRSNQTNRNIYNSFQFLNIVSTELLTSTEGMPNFSWVSAQDFKGLNANGQRFFWTLIYRQYQDFFTKNVGEIKDPKQFEGSYRIMGELIDTYNKMDKILGNNYNAENNAVNALNVSTQLLRGTELVIRLDTLFNKAHRNKANFWYENVFPTSESALLLMAHAQKKEYGAMSLQSIKFMEQIMIPIYGKRAPNTLKTFFFYMNFMVDMLTADGSTSTTAILERYALPSQSYRLKRHHQLSLSLNAFPGLVIGREQTLNTDNQININNWGTVAGITAPIGISLNSGQKGKNKDLSYSLFIPIIDIGAAFSYRWSNTAQGFPDDLRWAQVFSPGIFLAIGVPRTPIAFAFGTQLTPQLRSITTNNTVINNNTLRWSINTTVDIPFFNLYKKQ